MNSVYLNSLIVLIAILYGLIFMIYTPHHRIRQAPWMKGHFSHRGLFTQDQSIPENSLSAFKASLEAGFGIELDVSLSLDQKVMVFHDDDLYRACGVKESVAQLSSSHLKTHRLFKSEDIIPTLDEVLELIQGKVPLMIELKPTPHRKALVNAVKQCLVQYSGPVTCVSFDPLIVLEVRKSMPQILRGQLMEPYLKRKDWPLSKRLILQFGLLNGMTRPDYLSVPYTHLNLCYRINRWLRGFGVLWPVGSLEAEKNCQSQGDLIIFEHYRPEHF